MKWRCLCALCVSVVKHIRRRRHRHRQQFDQVPRRQPATRGRNRSRVQTRTHRCAHQRGHRPGPAPTFARTACSAASRPSGNCSTQIAPSRPRHTVLVATSAVRDAANGAEFARRIRAATGHELRILTGEEEANLIGRGLTSDPALADLQDFYVFDLGGGSLECLAFRARRVEQAVSLPLGCVRLTERCVKDPQAPFSDTSRVRVTESAARFSPKSGFRFSLPAGTAAVFAGGTITTARAIFAERLGRPLAETSPLIDVAALRALLDETARLPLAAAEKIPGLPAARADVFPPRSPR